MAFLNKLSFGETEFDSDWIYEPMASLKPAKTTVDRCLLEAVSSKIFQGGSFVNFKPLCSNIFATRS